MSNQHLLMFAHRSFSVLEDSKVGKASKPMPRLPDLGIGYLHVCKTYIIVKVQNLVNTFGVCPQGSLCPTYLLVGKAPIQAQCARSKSK